MKVNFEKISDIQDSRFMKVKVWVAHTGENRNNSIFSKELLESMIPSLANIPVLGYIIENNEKEKDFKGHEERLIIEDGSFDIKYFGRAYGVVPQENNAKFEWQYCEDGVEREFLTVEGLLWKKFDDVEEIFNRDGNAKSQSMELELDSVKGYVNDNGVFVFTSAKFEGLCILGENVTPAMISSRVERFSTNSLKEDMSEMLAEFNTKFSLVESMKGCENVENTEINNEQTPVTETEETVVTTEETPVEETQTEFEAEETSTEETEADTEGATPTTEDTNFADSKDEEKEEDDVDAEIKEDDKEEEEDFEKKNHSTEDKFTRVFELSHDDIRSSLYGSIDNHMANAGHGEGWYWIASVFESSFIAEGNGKMFKVSYSKENDVVSLGAIEEIFAMYLNASEKSAIEESRTNFSALSDEVKELREFKSAIELNEKEIKLSQYSTILSEEEYKSIKANLSSFSMTDIEKEIGFMLLKKNHFSAQSEGEASSNRVLANSTSTVSNPYGSLASYFQK